MVRCPVPLTPKRPMQTHTSHRSCTPKHPVGRCQPVHRIRPLQTHTPHRSSIPKNKTKQQQKRVDRCQPMHPVRPLQTQTLCGSKPVYTPCKAITNPNTLWVDASLYTLSGHSKPQTLCGSMPAYTPCQAITNPKHSVGRCQPIHPVRPF